MPCILYLPMLRNITRCACLACLAHDTVSTYGLLQVSLLDFQFPTRELLSHHKPRSISAWLVHRGDVRRCQWAAAQEFQGHHLTYQRWTLQSIRLLR